MRRAGYVHLYGLNLVFDRVGRGRPVVLLAEEAGRWPEELPEGFAFYLPDLPGYGRTGGPSLAPEELAEYAVAFAVMLNLGNPSFLLRGVGLLLRPFLEARGFTACPAEGDLTLVLSGLCEESRMS